MTPWYAPTSFSDNVRRILALRTALVMSVVIALVFTEFRFDWIENVVGAYLVSSNDHRPESGAVWDQGHQSDLARKTLSQFTHERSGAQREVRRAASLGQVIDGMDPERGAMISAGHFVSLYQKLPPVLSHDIVSPYILLAQLSGNQWKRTFFERQGGEQINIYLLDDHNQVLHRLSLRSVQIDHIHRGEVAIQTPLDQLGDFAGQIYPAERFFEALNTLPEDAREGVLDRPETLLAVTGRIVRVGISSLTVEGSVDLGFEVEDASGIKVILTQGMAWDVSRLQWILDSEGASAGQGQGGQ